MQVQVSALCITFVADTTWFIWVSNLIWTLFNDVVLKTVCLLSYYHAELCDKANTNGLLVVYLKMVYNRAKRDNAQRSYGMGIHLSLALCYKCMCSASAAVRDRH